MTFLLQSLAILVTIGLTGYILPGINVKNTSAAVIGALVLALINAFIRHILLFFAIPLNWITFGLFTFVINSLLIMLAAAIVDGFSVKNFWWALAFSVILSLITTFIFNMFNTIT